MCKSLPRYLLLIMSLFIFLYASISYADEDKKYTKEDYWVAISKRPDVVISTSKDPNTGEEIKIAKFKGGVDIYSDGLEIDNSGLGAVRCARELLIVFPAIIKKCGSDTWSEDTREIVARKLEEIIKKIDHFYAENSILPVSLMEVEEDTRKRTEEAEENMQCDSEIAKNLLKNQSDENFRGQIIKMEKDLTKVLSVARPPVLNPCL